MADLSFIHNSHDIFYREPFGAIGTGEKIRLSLGVMSEEVKNNYPGSLQVVLILEIEGKGEREIPLSLSSGTPGSKSEEAVFETELTVPSEPGLLWYYFKIFDESSNYYCGSPVAGGGGVSKIYPDKPLAYQITVYRKGEDSTTPDWFKNGIIYQIFPDRFYNGYDSGRVLKAKKGSLLHAHWDNEPVYIRDECGAILRWDFFGGNLQGVIKKLPYLKRLGVNIIYFNPIFESPSNHRYDTGDYHRTDPMLGTNRLFARLCREARRYDMAVILDGVFSHTGSDSLYFNKEGNYPYGGAFQTKDSPYFSWYRFSDYPHEYESWWGISNMPNVNELDPSYQDFVIFGENSVIKHWMKLGAAGWRLDVADELPTAFIRSLRRIIKEQNQDAVLIGEVWEDASNKISYGERRSYLLGDELDSVMNYPFREQVLAFLHGKIDGNEVASALLSLTENYPPENFYATMNLLGSHDRARLLTVLEENLPSHLGKSERVDIAARLSKLAVIWQMTFPGAPSVYYGDEAGLRGGSDPENRRPYPWGREDKDLFHFYRELIALRRQYPVLRTGYWRPVYCKGDIFSFSRTISNKKDALGKESEDNFVLIVLNRNQSETHTVNLTISPEQAGNLFEVSDDYRTVEAGDGNITLNVEPLQARIFIKERWAASDLQKREFGILMHPTSLPGPFGIGGLGREAFEFVDFLKEAGQQLWQFLPLNPPGFGESPYQCYSAFAGNPLLIDPEKLANLGLLAKKDLEERPGFPADFVDFSAVKTFKEKLFAKAYRAFRELEEAKPRSEVTEESINLLAGYDHFCEKQSYWLPDHALYMALQKHFDGLPWTDWPEGAARRREEELERYRRELPDEIGYQKFLQYIFFRQWGELKDYALRQGISMVGDLPIFVAHDSSDVWKNPHLFSLNEEGMPRKVAGVPPDYFSENGQLWGNPHYRWKEMAKDDYRWWRERFTTLSELVDIIRVDHFRGFEAYWEVRGGSQTARVGKWVKGPGEKFFRVINKYLGHLRIIAEDLGVITEEVEDMKYACGYPGMKIIQFALEETPQREFTLPLADNNTFVYTGTHDNDTILGWYNEKYRGQAPEYVTVFSNGENGERVEKRLKIAELSDKEICRYFIGRAYHSPARAVIIPLQDILALDSSARMNTPGTVGNKNWLWRHSPTHQAACQGDGGGDTLLAPKNYFSAELASEIKSILKTHL